MNFAALQSFVLGYLDIGTGDALRVEQVKTELRQSHLRIVWRYKLKAGLAALSTVANDARVDLPDDFVSVESLWRGGQQLFPIQRRELAGLLSSANVLVTGPVSYVFEGPDRLRIYPAPTATADAALTLDYLARPTPMVAFADLPDAVPEEWHDLIGWEALEAIALGESALDISQAAGARIEKIRELDSRLTNRGGLGSSQIRLAGYTSPVGSRR